MTTAVSLVIAATASAADVRHHRVTTPAAASHVPIVTQVSHVAPVGKANRIVVYSASWCAACQRLKPVLASLKHEGYKVEYRSVDENPDQLKFAYTALPTIFFLRGESLIKKEIGYRSKEHLKKNLVRQPEPEPVITVAQRD
jgi:thiol-disulfide isomerase/thioredoxin